MTTSTRTTRFEEVLENEHLANLDLAFADPGFCDEVPLYSRYEQIAFLKDEGDIDSALIKLALDYLDRLNRQLKLGSGGWAAISVVRDDVAEPILPSVFVCKCDGANQLSTLRLVAPPTTDFGRYVCQLVSEAGNGAQDCFVLEDNQTVPGDTRIFVSKSMPPIPVLMHG